MILRIIIPSLLSVLLLHIRQDGIDTALAGNDARLQKCLKLCLTQAVQAIDGGDCPELKDEDKKTFSNTCNCYCPVCDYLPRFVRNCTDGCNGAQNERDKNEDTDLGCLWLTKNLCIQFQLRNSSSGFIDNEKNYFSMYTSTLNLPARASGKKLKKTKKQKAKKED